MSTPLTERRLRVVLYEGTGATPLPAARRSALLVGLLSDGHSVTRPMPGGDVAAGPGADHVVIAEFDNGGAGLEGRDGLRIFDIAGRSVDEVRATVRGAAEDSGHTPAGAWKPWFPVIDYERCTNCMQCLTFCLFDVYGVDADKQITVSHQDNCKTDCPACSRVCPEAAIMFPKYKSGPINGAPVRDEDLQREAMKVDISALLGGDIYHRLRERSTEARKRFSTERDESKALLERKRCLKKLQKDFDIPDEVLMTLPSAGDIEERARRAREKAEKRAARSKTVQDRQSRPATPEEWGL